MTRFWSLTGYYSRYRLKTYVAPLNATIVAAKNTATLVMLIRLLAKMATSGISRNCDVKRTISIRNSDNSLVSLLYSVYRFCVNAIRQDSAVVIISLQVRLHTSSYPSGSLDFVNGRLTLESRDVAPQGDIVVYLAHSFSGAFVPLTVSIIKQENTYCEKAYSSHISSLVPRLSRASLVRCPYDNSRRERVWDHPAYFLPYLLSKCLLSVTPNVINCHPERHQMSRNFKIKLALV